MLSKRLLKISSFVDKGTVLFDVGSDHALLPCFLALNGICDKVYAGDNKEGPLLRAKETIARFHLEDKVIPVLSDGLDKAGDDVETVSVSGMGYFTIETFFKRTDLSRFKKIIVQANRDTDALRRFISEHHYRILNEAIVEENFYYEIVVFDTSYGETLSADEIAYGPVLLKRKDPLLKEYLSYQLQKLEKIGQQKYDADIEKLKSVIEMLG